MHRRIILPTLFAGLAVLVGLILTVPGCRRPPAPPPSTEPEETGPEWFEDVTDKMGFDFVQDPGPVGDNHPLPQIIGSGLALFDFDGDGRLDLYLLNNGGPEGRPNQLYRQREDGTFANVSKGSGLDFSARCMGVAIGDVNNDGRPDVLVTMVGGVKLFLNNGDGTFTDVTKEAGLDNPAWAGAAAFLDYDRDGLLDLVVVNYVDFDPDWKCTATRGQSDYCSPHVFPPVISRLFHNAGVKDGRVRFEDVTLKSGLGKLPGPGLGVVCADFDGDGWIDIFIANDGKPNHLWVNQHDGTFKEEAASRGLSVNGMGIAQSGMGVGMADVDGDGMFDLFITHLTSEQHTLWKQGPRGVFHDASAQARLTAPRWRGTGFGTALADFDCDGWPDAVVAHGRVSQGTGPVYQPLGDHWGAYAERNQLLANDGSGHFNDISPVNRALCGTPNVARGLAVGDIDGDGALDLVLTTAGNRARVYRNVAPGRGHWLKVRAVEKGGKRDALGAELTLAAGGRRLSRVVRTAESYFSASDGVAHFGLGKADAYDAVEVAWPDGSRERFAGGPADRRVDLRQGAGEPLPRGKGAP
ncbi:MAG TPA: CRTAC1 family protein [Gemmataceae bacterium]|nr:CRTAC1 family protein [Gemmataceae bacterium]